MRYVRVELCFIHQKIGKRIHFQMILNFYYLICYRENNNQQVVNGTSTLFLVPFYFQLNSYLPDLIGIIYVCNS